MWSISHLVARVKAAIRGVVLALRFAAAIGQVRLAKRLLDSLASHSGEFCPLDDVTVDIPQFNFNTRVALRRAGQADALVALALVVWRLLQFCVKSLLLYEYQKVLFNKKMFTSWLVDGESTTWVVVWLSFLGKRGIWTRCSFMLELRWGLSGASAILTSPATSSPAAGTSAW